MSDISDTGYLVRLQAQLFCHDEETNGWITLVDNEIVDVMLVKCPASSNTAGEYNGSDNGYPPVPLSGPAYEYYIFGRLITNGTVVLECVIEELSLYVMAAPTFHYWVTTENKRFGIKFQTVEDSTTFAEVIKNILKTLSDETISRKEAKWNVQCRNYKKSKRLQFSALHELYVYPHDGATTLNKLPLSVQPPQLNKDTDISLKGICKAPKTEDLLSAHPVLSAPTPIALRVLNASTLDKENRISIKELETNNCGCTSGKHTCSEDSLSLEMFLVFMSCTCFWPFYYHRERVVPYVLPTDCNHYCATRHHWSQFNNWNYRQTEMLYIFIALNNEIFKT